MLKNTIGNEVCDTEDQKKEEEEIEDEESCPKERGVWRKMTQRISQARSPLNRRKTVGDDRNISTSQFHSKIISNNIWFVIR